VIHLTAGAVPGDAVVRKLLGDHRVELALLAGDVHLPMHMGVVDLLDVLDEREELRELLELRPLVVRRAHRHVHVDGLDDLRHGAPPRWVVSPR
jgi:hypothetical protein